MRNNEIVMDPAREGEAGASEGPSSPVHLAANVLVQAVNPARHRVELGQSRNTSRTLSGYSKITPAQIVVRPR